MFNKENKQEEQNFWVSYADLMAGLLFVFILVLGAILIKYINIQNNLSGQNSLVDDLEIKLSKSNGLVDALNMQLSKRNNLIHSLKMELNQSNDLIKTLSMTLLQSQNAFSDEQELNQNLSLEIEEMELENTRTIFRLNDTSKSLELSNDEISSLKNLIIEYEAKEKDKSKTISNLRNTISLSDDKKSKLESIIIIQKNKYKSIVDEFNIAKSKIKTLTGIRVKVIKELKRKLGSSINVDSKSGAIRFYSNILFDQNKFKLKEKSKKILSKTLKKYIKTILYNKKIKKYIDKIIIEGHTNTDGTYLHNLELSQKRALEVMKFLYSIEPKNKKLLEKYVSASGRSYSDIIKYKNYKENKNASRRIEIKFQLKNEKSIKQLSKYLNKKRR